GWDHNATGEARGDLAQDRPLAAIAITAAAEDDTEAATRQLPRGRQHALEGVRRMGIVDHDEEWLARADLLEASGHRPDRADRLADRPRRQPHRQPHPAPPAQL